MILMLSACAALTVLPHNGENNEGKFSRHSEAWEASSSQTNGQLLAMSRSG